VTIKITADLLKKIEPSANAEIIASLAKPLSKHMTAYEIDTPLRAAHFLAQAGHESAHFRTLHEYASGAAYEGRKDLGNVMRGDGKRYKGRGIFQLTGRANYRAYGKALGLDLENNPELAADPEVSVRVACEYWKKKGLSGWADRDDVNEITRRINGGYNGLADRKGCLARAKKHLAGAIVVKTTKQELPTEEVPDAPIAAEPAKPWWQSTEVIGTAVGWLTSLTGAIQSPYGLATIGIVAVATVVAVYVISRRLRREKIYNPVGEVA
jgi:putative chitinase